MHYSAILYAYALLFSSQAMALDIFAIGKTIELSSSSCKETESIVKTLEDWTKKKCKIIEGCKYDIHECLPEHIAGVVGKYSGFEGPNCWNLALVMKGILPGLRFSTKEEMAFYLNSPLCRNLNADEERRPGDVGAIRELVNNKAHEFHGFIYISDKLAFSKNGETFDSSYDLQSLENVYASYQIAGNEQCRGNQINMNSTCLNATSYFRCEGLDEYLKKRKPLSLELSNLVQETSVFEKCIVEPFLLDSKPLQDNAGKSIVDIAKALAKYTEDQIRKSKLSEEEKFIITSLDLRMRAISEQFKKSYKTEYSDALDLNRLNFK
jgi:hypothetical protein